MTCTVGDVGPEEMLVTVGSDFIMAWHHIASSHRATFIHVYSSMIIRVLYIRETSRGEGTKAWQCK